MWADKGSGCDLGPDYSLRGLTAAFCQLAAVPAAQGTSPSLLKRNLGSTSQYSLRRVMAKSRNIQRQRIFIIHRPSLKEFQRVCFPKMKTEFRRKVGGGAGMQKTVVYNQFIGHIGQILKHYPYKTTKL